MRIGEALRIYRYSILYRDITISDENIALRYHQKLERYRDSLVFCTAEILLNTHISVPQSAMRPAEAAETTRLSQLGRFQLVYAR
jgi:hypothetical protein